MLEKTRMSDLSPQYDERSRLADFGGRRPTAFVDAGRHSARVQFLRRAIVIVCVSAVALIGFILLFDPLHRLQLGFAISGVGLDGTRITMDRPRLSGYRADGQPYEIKAKSVVQDTRRPKKFELEQVEANLGVKDGSTTSIHALAGAYDAETDKLELTGSIRVANRGRYEMNLKSASIDLRANSIVSRDPVSVALSSGRVEAAGATYEESSQKIEFLGPVHSEFTDNSPDASAAEPETTQ